MTDDFARRALAATTAAMMGLVGTLASLPEGRARACGGCFSPPGTSASVVTAHRMALAMSSTQTTLWDQFAYAGNPEDFVWVLPTSPDARVELADNRFFELLEQQTNVQLQPGFAPVQTACPPPFDPCAYDRAPSAGGFADASAPPPPAPPPVTVHHEGTVGPYETATVSSEDPMALIAWLQERGYGVPDSLLPTIRYYGEMGLAFVALRLSGGEGVQRMQPVRVTIPGLSYVLPLRMIAAGVADKVGLRLFVFGEGRYEAQNFPNGTVPPGEVLYDWAASQFNYDALFQAALASNEGRTWVTTYSGTVPATLGGTYWDADGSFQIDDDLSVALEGLPHATLTRMEASLGVGALDRDLLLSASADSSEVASFFLVTRERNRPADVSCPPQPPPRSCEGTSPWPSSGGWTTMPSGSSGSGPRSRGGSTLCSATEGGPTAPAAGLAGLLALVGVALVVRRRRRAA